MLSEHYPARVPTADPSRSIASPPWPIASVALVHSSSPRTERPTAPPSAANGNRTCPDQEMSGCTSRTAATQLPAHGPPVSMAMPCVACATAPRFVVPAGVSVEGGRSRSSLFGPWVSSSSPMGPSPTCFSCAHWCTDRRVARICPCAAVYCY